MMDINKFDEVKGFIANNNFKLVSVENKNCILKAKITETSVNPYGFPHGGFIFGLADTAAGVAARSEGRKAMTVSADIDYLHASKGSELTAEAICIKDGKTISVYEVSVSDETRLIAKGSFTYFYLD